MKWIPLLIIAAVVLVVFVLKKRGQISSGDALAYLKDGALVIDVRSPGEFNSGHLSAAINIPLDELDTAIAERVQDHNQILLLHCQSGMRSAMARRKLLGMGYARVFNLGSLARAMDIVGE